MRPPDTVSEAPGSLDESAIRRFEDAWQGPARPAVEDFLPTDPPARLVAELVHIDLEFRFRAGDDVRVEGYLARFPGLDAPPFRAELIRAEFDLRARFRPPASPDEFRARFPDDPLDVTPERDGTGPVAATRPTRRAAPLTVTPTIPGYEIEGELGRGGMGVVFKARDLTLGRTVAVKTLGSVPGAESFERFAREAEAIARLDHPHIVPVYEVGEWHPGGGLPQVPFFVMKWYPGGGLDAAPAGPGTDPKAQARLVATVARAVAHAHRRGVLHRDLKPSNILLDEAGDPHVADFGLAGRFDPADPRAPTTAVVGTPAYMSPEQARTPKEVTTAADVYGLGAVLYHQLAGRAPFRADTPLATLDLVAGAPPDKPSAVNPGVPKDLETICLKCLRKDPAKRYASADELADDLDRYATGRPIHARPTPAVEHAWRWARRHPLLAGMGATTLAALLVAVVTLAESNARIREQEKATGVAYRREVAARNLLEAALGREQDALYLERVSAAGRLYAANQLPQAWAVLDRCPETRRRWEWDYLDALRRAGPVALAGHEEWVTAAAFLGDGRLATADRGGEVRVWDVGARKTTRAWRPGKTAVTALAAHPTRPWLAVVDNEAAAVWDVDTAERVRELGKEVHVVGFSPCGRWAAVGDRETVRVWAVPGWERKGEWKGGLAYVTSLAFAPDGGRLLAGHADGTIRSWSLPAGEAGPTWRRPRSVMGLAFTPDGNSLIEAHTEGAVEADPKNGQHRHRIDPTADGRSFVAVGPAPGWVAVAGPDREVVVWDVAKRRPARVFRGHTAAVSALAFSPDGKRVASGGGDQTVRVWDLEKEPGVRTLAAVGPWAASLAVSDDGARVAAGPWVAGKPTENRVLVLDAATGKEVRRFAAAGEVAFQPGTRRLATGRPGGGVVLWDADTGDVVWASPAPEGETPLGRRLAFSSDGSLLACWDPKGGLRLLKGADGTAAGRLDVGGGFVNAVAFSPTGDRLAVAQQNGLSVWDVESRTQVASGEPGRGAYAVAFSRDGNWLATADRDNVVRLRGAMTGQAVRSLAGGAVRVNALAFIPDGTRLVTGGSDEAARVWDVETGRELLVLPGVRGQVLGVAWTRDRVIALDDAVRSWSPGGE